MTKKQKFLIGVGILGAVGLTYAISTLKGLPDVFDWEDDELDA
jgi:hypothetical protein